MTKKEKILKHLKKYRKITPLEALNEYGSMRLGAVIFELRKNYKIRTNLIDVPTDSAILPLLNMFMKEQLSKWK